MPLFDDRALGALERGMDGMWLKQQIASHNIANVETPGYKAKKVEFRDVLYETAQGTERISKPVVEEDGNTQARPDGNNVQVEKEELELWKAYTQYSALTGRVSGKLSTLLYVINNTGK